MPVITMNVTCWVKPRQGSDAYGQPIFGKTRRTVCAVIKLTTSRQKSTVRVDSSGSVGHADEEVADIVLLMDKNEDIAFDDVLIIGGVSGRVSSVRQRYDAMGRLDHLEVGATVE